MCIAVFLYCDFGQNFLPSPVVISHPHTMALHPIGVNECVRPPSLVLMLMSCPAVASKTRGVLNKCTGSGTVGCTLQNINHPNDTI